MEVSIFLAKVLGLWFFIGCLAPLVRPKLFETIVKEFNRSEAFLYFTGFLSLIIGILIIVGHNVWMGWPIVITLVGWLIFIRGIVRIFFVENSNKILNWFLANKVYLYISLVVGLVIGLYLLYFGFIA